MKSILKQQLEQLVANGTFLLLKGALRGIEKEGLRALTTLVHYRKRPIRRGSVQH